MSRNSGLKSLGALTGLEPSPVFFDANISLFKVEFTLQPLKLKIAGSLFLYWILAYWFTYLHDCFLFPCIWTWNLICPGWYPLVPHFSMAWNFAAKPPVLVKSKILRLKHFKMMNMAFSLQVGMHTQKEKRIGYCVFLDSSGFQTCERVVS